MRFSSQFWPTGVLRLAWFERRCPPWLSRKSEPKNAEKKERINSKQFRKTTRFVKWCVGISCVLQYVEGLFRETVQHHFFLHIFFLCMLGSQEKLFGQAPFFMAKALGIPSSRGVHQDFTDNIRRCCDEGPTCITGEPLLGYEDGWLGQRNNQAT